MSRRRRVLLWVQLIYALVFWLVVMAGVGYVVMVLLPNFPFPTGCRP